MLIRIRSKDGNFRVEFQPKDDISKLVGEISERTVDADPSSITISNQPRGNETLVSRLRGRTLQSLGLKHGDMVFVNYKTKTTSESAGKADDQPTSSAPQEARNVGHAVTVQEHPVDIYWRSQSGKIPKGRDAHFCKHGQNGMCDYCMPLEPYDPMYQAEHNIKHLSYHAYLRKLVPAASQNTSRPLPPLSPVSYRVKAPCPSGGHPSWPAGICTACQPSAITLQSQPFRMVDHLEIASQDIVERFLQAWRATGLQRFGWLIGHYEHYDKVPMGIKAVVEAIHEPPQEGELDGLTLGLPWEDEQRIKELATFAKTPLEIVGYIFTDLEPTAEDRTKNVYKRHSQSFFMSSLETIFAATVQNSNPTPSQSSPSGYFGSRMVTAILTATEDGQVDISAFQVSEQACAMVDADMIEASVEPGIVRVKEEDRDQNSARYVPDVFYRYKNEYAIEVKKSAKPCFPVEYLLVNVTHGFPQNPSPLFRSNSFAIENRRGLEDQQVEDVLSSINRLDTSSIPGRRDASKHIELARWLSDWHLITFLGATQLISNNDIEILVRTATLSELTQDSRSLDELFKTVGWQTLLALARDFVPAQPSVVPAIREPAHDDDLPPELIEQIAAEEERAARAPGNVHSQACPHCTFENNHQGSDCEVCGLPLAQ